MVRVDLQQKLQILRDALVVRQDGHPRRGALDVKPAELERTVMAVNRAQKDTQGTEPILTLRSADTASWVRRRRRLVARRVNYGQSFLVYIFFSYFHLKKPPDKLTPTFLLKLFQRSG